jgi:hypothetical protein
MAPERPPKDHTAGRKPDFVLPSAEGSLGYPEDMLTSERPDGEDRGGVVSLGRRIATLIARPR